MHCGKDTVATRHSITLGGGHKQSGMVRPMALAIKLARTTGRDVTAAASWARLGVRCACWGSAVGWVERNEIARSSSRKAVRYGASRLADPYEAGSLRQASLD
jgi:hypothetical protein